MKEHPIIFSAPMVNAILSGKKTQTRRVVKIRKGGRNWHRDDPAAISACPYGQVGDRLWVRETWTQYQTVNSIKRLDGRSYSEVSDGLVGYRADGSDTIKDFREHIMLTGESDIEEVITNGDKWRPSIHMPRWASRITLEVTDVRIERLQDISNPDAEEEGIANINGTYAVDMDAPRCWQQARDAFQDLWLQINGPKSWDANPLVWRIEFRRVEQ
jgi:hypothetical protein